MIKDNCQDYINYRFKRALESFEDVLILSEKERLNAAINRLYYAGFYAVTALLLKKNIETRSHDGVRTQFGLQFVKTGIIDKKYGKLFSKLFDYRQVGDYGDLYDYNENIISPLIADTKALIDEIEKHLH
ncbi:MAG: HEPN domain-containing protein [Cyclobacteriaceae bacterium]|nr:HEPN domain-containing protein [Cyclobacteriaceae bacterium]